MTNAPMPLGVGLNNWLGPVWPERKMDTKLMPCPFCGSTPNEPNKTGGGDERNGYNFRVHIACRECGAEISRASHRDKQGWCDDNGQAKAAAIAAWNRRA